MTVLSKLCGQSFRYNCYEACHTWTPSCSKALRDITISVFTECTKMYSVIYLVLQIIQKKYSLKDFLNTAHNTFASSSFLAFNGFSLTAIFCLLRKILGGMPMSRIVIFLGGFLSCFLAIFLERKHRRGPLATYVAITGTEVLFRMAVARDMITPIPNGEILLFCAAIAFYCYVIRKYEFPRDNVGSAIKCILGVEEATCMNKSAKQLNILNDQQPSSTDPEKMEESETAKRLLSNFQRWTQTKHSSCPHKLSCAQYSAQGFLQPFAIACISSLGIQCASMLRNLLFKPSHTFRGINYKSAVNIGLFLGGFGWTFRTVNCVLRWLFDEDAAEYALPAAFLGGLFMKFFPSTSLALYLAGKAVELLYNIGLENGKLPEIQGFMVFLYAISGGIVFYAICTEPQSVKRDYLQFLYGLTHNKFNQINRRLLEETGVATIMNSTFWPSLDERYTSEAYKRLLHYKLQEKNNYIKSVFKAHFFPLEEF